MRTRQVHVQRGQTIVVHAGGGVELEVTREQSGAVTVRNLATANILRQWSPKEARRR